VVGAGGGGLSRPGGHGGQPDRGGGAADRGTSWAGPRGRSV
jgi:hypothetical protein